MYREEQLKLEIGDASVGDSNGTIIIDKWTLASGKYASLGVTGDNQSLTFRPVIWGTRNGRGTLYNSSAQNPTTLFIPNDREWTIKAWHKDSETDQGIQVDGSLMIINRPFESMDAG